MKTIATLAPLLQGFFTERLAAQRQASSHTQAAYRDSFRLLLNYAERFLRKRPSDFRLEDIDAGLVGRFLNHLERDRGNAARTRNLRLAAIHSFCHYVASKEPRYLAHVQRILALPSKRCPRKLVAYLTRAEVEALLSAPDLGTRSGRRDHAMLSVAVQTGLRASELTALRCQDVSVGMGAHVRCYGKGRKERCTPLSRPVRKIVAAWLTERAGEPTSPAFPNARDKALSTDGFQYILAKHVAVARRQCPSLSGKRISPHVLRHTTAMDLLHSGVDLSVIALWLGHESVETTQIYVHANMALKERVLEKARGPSVPPGRFEPGDRLMAFLESL